MLSVGVFSSNFFKRCKPTVLIAGLSLLSACSIDSQISKSSHEAWDASRQKEAAPSVTQTWQPSSESSDQKLTLDAALDLALQNNPSTKAMWFAARAAAAARGKAASDFYPEIDVTGAAERSKVSIGGGIPPILRSTNSAAVELTYTLLDFGGRLATYEASRQSLLAANFDFNRALQELVFAVYDKFYALQSAKAAFDANKLSLADAQSNLDAATTSNRVGMSPKQDVLKAQSNYERAVFELESSVSKVEQARAALAEILGVKVSQQLDIEAEPEKPVEKLAKDVSDLIAQALDIRPDLQAERAKSRAESEQETFVISEALPKLVTRSSANKTDVHDQVENEENFQVALELQIPLFSGFRNWYALKQAEARTEQAQQQVIMRELEVASQVWSSYHEFSSALRQLESGKARLNASQEAYRVIGDGYKSGVNSLLDLISAQNDLAQARRDLISSQSAVAVSIAKLGLAVGDIQLSKSEHGG